MNSKQNFQWSETVSYTHLDVYKRQVCCSMRNKCQRNNYLLCKITGIYYCIKKECEITNKNVLNSLLKTS